MKTNFNRRRSTRHSPQRPKYSNLLPINNKLSPNCLLLSKSLAASTGVFVSGGTRALEKLAVCEKWSGESDLLALISRTQLLLTRQLRYSEKSLGKLSPSIRYSVCVS